MQLLCCITLTIKKELHISPWGVLPAGMAEEEEQDFIGLFEAKANKLATEKWRLRVLLEHYFIELCVPGPAEYIAYFYLLIYFLQQPCKI